MLLPRHIPYSSSKDKTQITADPTRTHTKHYRAVRRRGLQQDSVRARNRLNTPKHAQRPASICLPRLSSPGSRSMNCFTTAQASCKRVADDVGPCGTGPSLRPSSSYRTPSISLQQQNFVRESQTNAGRCTTCLKIFVQTTAVYCPACEKKVCVFWRIFERIAFVCG